MYFYGQELAGAAGNEVRISDFVLRAGRKLAGDRGTSRHTKSRPHVPLSSPMMVCKAWLAVCLYVHMGGGKSDNSGRLRWAVVVGVQPVPAGRKKNFCKSRTNTNRL